MLDFLLQTAGIVTGLGLGSCLYGWLQRLAALRMGDPTPGQEEEGFWSWRHVDPLALISMALVQVGWPKGHILRPQATPSPRLTMMLCVLLPTGALLISALLGASTIKHLAFLSPHLLQVLEAMTRTVITMTLTLLIPLPPLEGWRLLTVLVTGEIRPGKRFFFPSLLLALFLLELLTKVAIIDLWFGPLADGIFLFLYLIG